MQLISCKNLEFGMKIEIKVYFAQGLIKPQDVEKSSLKKTPCCFYRKLFCRETLFIAGQANDIRKADRSCAQKCTKVHKSPQKVHKYYLYIMKEDFGSWANPTHHGQ